MAGARQLGTEQLVAVNATAVVLDGVAPTTTKVVLDALSGTIGGLSATTVVGVAGAAEMVGPIDERVQPGNVVSAGGV